METIQKTDFIKDLLIVLRETFEGSPEGHGSVYLDRGVGFFSTIDALDGKQASAPFEGTTVAAQTEHAKFYLDRLCEFIDGRTQPVNWEDSWLIETVNDREWEALRNAMRASYEKAVECIARVEAWDDSNIGDAIALVTHSAYHLGSVRQIAKTAQADKSERPATAG